MVLNDESGDENLKCDYSNESHWAVLSCGIYLIALWNTVLNFESVDYDIQIKAI